MSTVFENDDYPAIFRSAELLSERSQRVFLRSIFFHIMSLVIAAGISVLNSSRSELAILQTVVLLGALGCSVYLAAKRPDKLWYGSRAIAESVKTITWRFICRAEPFEESDDVSKLQFLETLRLIVDQNKSVAVHLDPTMDGTQVTSKMAAIRQLSLSERKSLYLSQRVEDQFAWYTMRAHQNRRRSNYAFMALILVNAVGVTAAIIKINSPGIPYWPTDAVIAIAGGVLIWTQTKRYSEHAASYALAAHEISIIREQSDTISDEAGLSQFVGDSENAFSREHTQWIARKDS